MQIASGRDHAYALDTSGRVWAWGDNSFGQIGDGTTARRSNPVRLGLTNVVLVEAGHYHGLALRADGTVWTWGYGTLGQLGLGDTSNRSVPTQVPGLNGIARVAGGRDMSYAIDTSGGVYAWGNNSFGEVGDGTTQRRTGPVKLTGVPALASISGGRNHAVAVTSQGQVWTWGDNRYGQLGDGTQVQRTRPVLISLGGVRHADAGAHHSIAVDAAGNVHTWGRGYRGQLGHGTTASVSMPTRVAGLPVVVQVGDGRDQSYAITASGAVWSWGNNDDGQLGDGTTTRRTRPVAIAVSGVTVVQGGSAHAVLFRPTSSAPNAPPVPDFAASCQNNVCQFDASASYDPDGTITNYGWLFGDGGSGTGRTTTHTFVQGGSFNVTLTVTDNAGESRSLTRAVLVTLPPPAATIEFRSASAVSVNAVQGTVASTSGTRAGDVALLIATANRGGANLLVQQAGWSPLGTVESGSMTTRAWWRVLPAGTSTVTVGVGQTTKLDLQLLVYGGVNPTTPVAAAAFAGETVNRAGHTTPVAQGITGGWVVSYWADKTSATTNWTPPPNVIQRSLSIGTGSGRITSLAVDSGGPVGQSQVGGLTATASSSNAKATMATIVLAPEEGAQ